MLVPVGGGGLIAGISTALAALSPNTRVIGVEPELAADAQESLQRGQRVSWATEDTCRTIADGVRLHTLGELPWRHIQRYVHDIITVTEDEILAAMRTLVLDYRIVAEPSGALAPAAAFYHLDSLPSGRTLAVVSGGNADPELWAGRHERRG